MQKHETPAADHAGPVPDHMRDEPQARFLSRQQLLDRWGCKDRRLQELKAQGEAPRELGLGAESRYLVSSVLELEERRLASQGGRL
mgnify:CR=1 FL=1